MSLSSSLPWLILLAVLALSAVSADAFAGRQGLSDPQQVVEDVSDGLVRILREQRRRLETDPSFVYEIVDELLLPRVDVDRISALVLGRHWRTASASQRVAFNREFQRLVIQTYATAIRELSADGWDVIYLPERKLGGGRLERVLVRTQIARPGAKPVSVDYSMVNEGGRWLAYDVTVEGVSLLTNYRSTFGRLISQKGLDGLIRDLAARNDMKKGS